MRSCSLNCGQLEKSSVHQMGVRPQRILIVALYLHPIELDQGTTRDQNREPDPSWCVCLWWNYGKLELWYLFIELFLSSCGLMWIYLVGGWFEMSLYLFPTECPAHLQGCGFATVLSYWCGIIGGQKIIRGEDRINVMSRCDTGVWESTVKNKEVFVV